MDLKTRIDAYWESPEQRKLLVDIITRLVAVRSVREDAQPGAPFGPGPARCLGLALDICRELGFSVENVDNYVGTADLNDKETVLHILGHLDVVGEGKGWSTDPYTVVEKDGMALELTQREYDLVRYLAAQPGKAFSREALMENVWNYDGYVGDVRGVDVAVRRLREKLEDDPANPAFIVTRRGLGYLFNA